MLYADLQEEMLGQKPSVSDYRARLRSTDFLLGSLEELNMRKVQKIPGYLQTRLVTAGAEFGKRPRRGCKVQEALDFVFDLQDELFDTRPILKIETILLGRLRVAGDLGLTFEDLRGGLNRNQVIACNKRLKARGEMYTRNTKGHRLFFLA